MQISCLTKLSVLRKISPLRNVFLTTLSAMVRDPKETTQINGVSGCIFNLIPWGVLVILVFGTVIGLIASNWALPGDRLYLIKREIEKTRLNLTSVPSQRIDLEYQYDKERQEEIESLQKRSRVAVVEYPGGFTEVISQNKWQVGDREIIINSNTEITGEIQKGTYITVLGTINPDGSIDAQQILPREYIFKDKLHSVATNQWLVDGVTLLVAYNTVFHGNPGIDSLVQVAALRLLDDQLVARFIEELSP